MNRELFQHNQQAWDSLVEKGNQWTVPVSPEEIEIAKHGQLQLVLTPTKPVPQHWLGDVRGKEVLCLCGGGGQQAPLFAAAGARTTTVDLSELQLARDQEVAIREGLTVNSLQGRMGELGFICDQQFDLIFHPCSNCFTPDIEPVWAECHRILKPGGRMVSGFCCPYTFIFDPFKAEEGELVVQHSVPFSDKEQLSEDGLRKLAEDNEPLMFGHTFGSQIGGQLKAGFVLADMYEDRWEVDSDPLSKFISPYMATLAIKKN